MRLFIAEKPSLARAIADALPGSAQRRDGYLECSNGDVVAWCAGHILELAPPMPTIPISSSGASSTCPSRRGTGSSPSPPRIFSKTIKMLLPRASVVVNAGDPDREGQLLVDEVLVFLGYRGRVDRVLVNDLNVPAVRKSIDRIESNERFRSLYEAALGRQRADWLYGINMTRLYTVLGRQAGYQGVLSVGPRPDAPSRPHRPARCRHRGVRFEALLRSCRRDWWRGPSVLGELAAGSRVTGRYRFRRPRHQFLACCGDREKGPWPAGFGDESDPGAQERGSSVALFARGAADRSWAPPGHEPEGDARHLPGPLRDAPTRDVPAVRLLLPAGRSSQSGR